MAVIKNKKDKKLFSNGILFSLKGSQLFSGPQSLAYAPLKINRYRLKTIKNVKSFLLFNTQLFTLHQIKFITIIDYLYSDTVTI